MTKQKVENRPIREYFNYNNAKDMLKSDFDKYQIGYLRTYIKIAKQDEDSKWYNDVNYKKLHDENKKTLYGREIATIKNGKYPLHWSACSMYHQIRDNLFYDSCIDIDQCNSTPTISQFLFKFYGLKCENTDDYVKDRPAMMNYLCKQIGFNIEKEELKNLIIASVYFGGSKDNYLKGTLNIQCPKELINELNGWSNNSHSNVTKILNSKRPVLGINPNEIYEWKKKDILDKKLDKNPLTSAWSFLCQEIEGKITQFIIDFYTSYDFILNSKIYDGCHLRQPGKSIDESIELFNQYKEDCEEFIFDELGIPMKIAVKPMNKHDFVENIKLEDKDETYAGKEFIRLMGTNLKKECNKIYFFDKKTHLWGEHSKDSHYKYFNDLGNKMIFQQEDDSGNVRNINYSTIVRNIDNAFKIVNSNLCNELFIQKGLDKTVSLCLFNNGIFDFKTGLLKPLSDYDSSYFFKYKIDRNYTTERNVKLEDKLNKQIFIDPFYMSDKIKDEVDKEKGDLSLTGKFLKESIANAMLGNYMIKKFYFCSGLSNSGKGIVCEALDQTFENYVGSFNGNSLFFSTAGGDEAKKNSWMEVFNGKKLCFSNEASIDGRKTIDINQIKRIASGGDKIEFRKNFQDEQILINRAMCFFFSNEIPALSNSTDDGIVKRCKYIRYNRVFEETMPEGLTEENSYYSQADLFLKDNLKTLEYKIAFFNIIADCCREIYKIVDDKDTYTIIEPESVSMEGKEIVASETGEFKSDFWKCFERTELETDRLTIKNITRIFNEKFHVILTSQKVGLDMKKYLTDIKRKMIHNVVNITNIKIREEPKQRLIPTDDCIIDVSEEF